MAYVDIQIALFTGYPNYYPYPTETPIPYPYLYPGENIRILIQTIRELSDPKGIRIRFCPELTETIRSVFIDTVSCPRHSGSCAGSAQKVAVSFEVASLF